MQPKIDYTTLTHQLEGSIDQAIRLLATVSHPVAKVAKRQLIAALRHTENQIIGEPEKILEFPQP